MRAGLKMHSRGQAIDLERENRVLRIRRSHTLYVPHMIENFDYYFNSVVPVNDGDKLLVDMSGPRLHTLIGFDETPFLFPSHTEPYSTTAEYLEFADLHPGMTVLDIGAYSGVTSIIFARLVGPTGRVFAFEADERNYQCASTNITQAKAGDVVSLANKAVWCHNDGLIFSNEGTMGSSAVAITGGGRGDERLVETTTIERFCSENAIEHIDFVKIDIEGAETEVLRSSALTLRRLGARVIVEPHRVGGKLNTEECCQLARAAGFRVHVRSKSPGSEALIELTQ